MSSKGYFWSLDGPLPEIQDHSLAKHEVLRAYLVNYLRILAQSPRSEGVRITLVDGFAGGGMYRTSTGAEVGGSPLVLLDALREARALVETDREAKGVRMPYVIKAKVHLVEAHRSNHAFLERVIRQHSLAHEPDTEVVVHKGTFESKLPSILEDVRKRQRRGGRSVFVLDQYGWTDVDLRDVRSIFEILPSAEVFLTWMVDSLINFLSEKTADKLNPAIASAGFADHITVEHLLSLRAGDSDHASLLWRRMIQSLLSEEIRKSAGAAFRTPFYIVPKNSRRGYWLLHLSQHLRANEEMKRIHWQNTNLHHPGGAGLGMLGYIGGNGQLAFDNRFDLQARESTVKSLMSDLPSWLSNQRGAVRFGDLLAATANETPAIRSQMQQAVFDLAARRELILRTVTGAKRRGATGLSEQDVIELNSQMWLLPRHES